MEPHTTRRGGRFGQALRTVLSASFGVRRRSGHEHDAPQLGPLQLIIAALAGAALFVLALVLIVRAVTR